VTHRGRALRVNLAAPGVSASGTGPSSEHECERPGGEEEAALDSGLYGFVHGPPRQLEIHFAGSQLLRTQGKLARLEEVDAGR
jgi:hypothetical protein